MMMMTMQSPSQQRQDWHPRVLPGAGMWVITDRQFVGGSGVSGGTKTCTGHDSVRIMSQQWSHATNH